MAQPIVVKIYVKDSLFYFFPWIRHQDFSGMGRLSLLVEICPSGQTLVTSPPHRPPLFYIFFNISGDFSTSSSVTPTLYVVPIKYYIGTYWLILHYLWTKCNSTSGKLGDKNTTHSCKCWLSILLSRLKNFNFVNLMVGKSLVYFSMLSNEL